MLTQEVVKIPSATGRIRYMEKDGSEYVLYLVERKYNSEKKVQRAGMGTHREKNQENAQSDVSERQL